MAPRVTSSLHLWIFFVFGEVINMNETYVAVLFRKILHSDKVYFFTPCLCAKVIKGGSGLYVESQGAKSTT